MKNAISLLTSGAIVGDIRLLNDVSKIFRWGIQAILYIFVLLVVIDTLFTLMYIAIPESRSKLEKYTPKKIVDAIKSRETITKEVEEVRREDAIERAEYLLLELVSETTDSKAKELETKWYTCKNISEKLDIAADIELYYQEIKDTKTE